MSDARVLVRSEAKDHIAVEITSDFAGDFISTFELDPSQAASLRDLVHDWEHGGRSAANVSSSIANAQADRMQRIGDVLFQYLNSNNQGFAHILQQALSIPNAKLKVQLRLRGDDLVDLPWELLHHSAAPDDLLKQQLGFLASSDRIAISRYHEAPIPLAQPEKLDRLRVLVVVANPKKDQHDLAALVRSEVARLRLIGETTDRLKLEILEGTTRASLHKYLCETAAPPHVLHFIGYGYYEPPTSDPDDPPEAPLRPASTGLVLEKADHSSDFVPAGDFARLLPKASARAGSGGNSGGAQPALAYPKLVTLVACHSAHTSLSVANALVNEGVPAVIGMRLPVSSSLVLLFYQGLYTQLLDGVPVDEAVAACRYTLQGSWKRTIDWGIPVLFLRAQMGKLFEFNANSHEFANWVKQLQSFSELAGKEAAAAMQSLAALGVSTAALAVAVALSYPIAAVRAKAAALLRRLPVSESTNTQIVHLIGPAIRRESEPEVRAEFVRLLARPPLAPDARSYLAYAQQDGDEHVRFVANKVNDSIVHGQLSLVTDLSHQLQLFAASLASMQRALTVQLAPTPEDLSYLRLVETALARVRKLEDAVTAHAIGAETSPYRNELNAQAKAASDAIYAADRAARQLHSFAERLAVTLNAAAGSLAHELDLLYELQRITGDLAEVAFADDMGEIDIVATHPDEYPPSGLS